MSAPSRNSRASFGVDVLWQVHLRDQRAKPLFVAVAQARELAGDLRDVVRQDADDDASIGAGVEDRFEMRFDSRGEPLPRVTASIGRPLDAIDDALDALLVNRQQQAPAC